MVSEPNAVDSLVPRSQTTPTRYQNGKPTLSTDSVNHRSVEWAKQVRMFGLSIIILVFTVVVLPFLFILFKEGVSPQSQTDLLERWSFMILAPVIGLASAVVGYYFGTNGAGK
jgi:hypothetical protein